MKEASEEYIVWNDMRLPPKSQRFCGSNWGDDEFYVSSAREAVTQLRDLTGLSDTSRLLDIGSGQGRLAIGLAADTPGFEGYVGIDVHLPSVQWCRRNISGVFPCFQFLHLDFKNERYNPSGVPFRSPLALPFEDASFDVAFLYSVFTHMLSADVRRYLKELHRLLRANGRAFFTVYVEDDCEDEVENPAGYLESLGVSKGALHRVRFNRSHFERMLRDAGLEVVRYFPHSEVVTQQSSYLVGVA